ncbi:MAG TPA: hypothetical protein VMF08_17220 [Candidatus Sulfotelmatobacter sp.]|nr:hypothetical protein [Candidatus Sulfotelmatobacter sp.]
MNTINVVNAPLHHVGQASCLPVKAASSRVFRQSIPPIIQQSINPIPAGDMSPHSALMGGQFPQKRDFGTFKSPLFFDVFRRANRPKIELSLSMVKKTGFYLENPQKIEIFTAFSQNAAVPSKSPR